MRQRQIFQKCKVTFFMSQLVRRTHHKKCLTYSIIAIILKARIWQQPLEKGYSDGPLWLHLQRLRCDLRASRVRQRQTGMPRVRFKEDGEATFHLRRIYGARRLECSTAILMLVRMLRGYLRYISDTCGGVDTKGCVMVRALFLCREFRPMQSRFRWPDWPPMTQYWRGGRRCVSYNGRRE